ncbi:hypothetical protein Riv7116_4867 [Rivularia sp. PCC 7116]|uniref:FIST signal transduction protein n=1 Tax=Rivularia sp. PCC 7116 TaxID=373994 RepID=UPI00029EE388|nr:FIST N-terminal domain-containing protein [Rivularia sp. PCC 7116]AFY57278.1 hypothetical protein Riv7116_4867 [Rivularia sp. PCC 7116]
MKLNRAIAYCRNYDSFTSGEVAAKQVVEKIGKKPDFLLLFASIGHDISLILKGIKSIIADVPICGCTSFGNITHLGHDESSHSIALMGLQSNVINSHPFIFDELEESSQKVGREIASKLNNLKLSESTKQLLFLFPDAKTLNSTSLFQSIEDHYQHKLEIVGGGAANDYLVPHTLQFCNQSITKHGVSGFLMSGDFDYSIGISHGSKAFGKYRCITRACGNTIYEIDEQPALEVVTSLLGLKNLTDISRVQNILGLGGHSKDKGYFQDTFIRAIVSYSETENTIQVSSEMPEGLVFRFTRRNINQVLSTTQYMVDNLLASMKEPENASYFYFNCDGRGSLLFGEETETDIDVLFNIFGKNSGFMGFFAFTEIAPFNGQNICHAYTGVLVGIE